MGSLTGCFKKAGASLHPQDKAEILTRARALRKTGMTANAAALRAIDSRIDALRASIPAEVAVSTPTLTTGATRARDAGRSAFSDGKPRALPAELTKIERKAWAAGWDEAEKASGPISSVGAPSAAKKARRLDPERDTLLQAIAKLGGIDRDQMAKEFGLKPEELKHTVRVGNLKAAPFRVEGGRTWEDTLTGLREAGYFAGVADGDARAAFEAAVFKELGGGEELTPQGQMRRAAEMQEDLRSETIDALDADELEQTGYAEASDDVKELTQALLAKAEAGGLDIEALRETAARLTEDQTKGAYHAELQRLAQEALAGLETDGRAPGEADAEGARTSAADRGEGAGDAGAQAEGLKPPEAEPDIFKALFGTQAEQAAEQAKFRADALADAAAKNADVQRIRSAIENEKKRAAAEHDDWAGRVYKQNKTQVELRGDGPSRNPSMSIGAINESRRRNAMDALAKEMKELGKLTEALATDSGADRVLSNLRGMYAKAQVAVDSGNWPGMDLDAMFESMLLDDLKFRGPGGKGNVTSNGLSKAVLSAIKPGERALLETQTAADLKAKADREAETLAADKAEQKRLADKEKADAQRGEFTLTGSDRAADIGAAAGQQVMFDLSVDSQAPEVIERGPAPLADRALVGRVEKLFRQSKGFADLSLTALPRISEPTTQDHPEVRNRFAVGEIAKLLGRRTVWFSSNRLFAHGMVINEAPGVIFLNENTPRPVFAVFGHEITHSLKLTRPDLYAKLEARIMALTKSGSEFTLGNALNSARATKGLKPLSLEKLREEYVANVTGDNMDSAAFWKEFLDVPQAEKSGMQKVLQAILDWFDSVLSKLKNSNTYGTAQHIKDLRAARTAVVSVMREFAKDNGLAMPTSEGVDIALSHPNDPFFSALARQVDKAVIQKGDAAAWKGAIKGWINTGAVKKDEVEWTGLNEWLDLQQGKITRQQVGDFLNANGVQVTETVLGDRALPAGWTVDDRQVPEEDREYPYHVFNADGEIVGAGNTESEAISDAQDSDADDAKYGYYQLPGGSNYREVLLTLPKRIADPARDEYEAWAKRKRLNPNYPMAEREYEAETGREAPSLLQALRREAATNFTSSHWDQPNVLAHIRLNDRTDAEGKRVLFVEEIQSDWGQAGKKKGFEPGAQGQRRFQELGAEWDRLAAVARGPAITEQALKAKEAAIARQGQISDEMNAISDAKRDGIPNAPFVGKTEAWVSLALKRVIKMAVDEGYDRVAMVTGAQSAERYDLSKHIDHIDYRQAPPSDDAYDIAAVDMTGRKVLNESGIKLARIEELVGKDVAQKIANGEGQSGGGRKTLRGLDLKVGGEGMKAFYDKIVPSVAKDVLRKVGGGQMTSVGIQSNTEGWHITPPEHTTSKKWMLKSSDYNSKGLHFDTQAEAKAALAKKLATNTQPGFGITPTMREKAAGGLPMFSLADRTQTETPAFAKWFGDSVVTDTGKPMSEGGKPLVMYHGTADDFNVFDPANSKHREEGSLSQAHALFVTADQAVANEYATNYQKGSTAGANVMPVYVKAERPFDFDKPDQRNALVDEMFKTGDVGKLGDGQEALKLDGRQTLYTKGVLDEGLASKDTNWTLMEMPEVQSAIKTLGHDGFYLAENGKKNLGVYDRTQIKSVFNRGTFDPTNPDISLDLADRYTDAQKDALRRAGIAGKRTLGEKIRDYFTRASDTVAERNEIASGFRQGALDQFHGIARAVKRDVGALDANQDPYVAARLANGGVSSVMRGLMLHGQAKWAANGQHLEKIEGTKGLLDILKPLGEDLNDFFGWMIGNRAARLMKEGREKNFTKEQIAELQGLGKGKEELFRKTASEYAAFKRSVLDIAEGAGLIKGESRKVWDNADYIPFYREIDDKAVFGATGKKGLAGQTSGIRTLKGGTAALNDPMENVLMNFSRLIDASLKNNAISATERVLSTAKSDVMEKIGYDMSSQIIPAAQVRKVLAQAGTPEAILDVIPEEAFEGMAKMWAIQAPTDPSVVRIMRDGKPEFYRVNDPLLLKALTSFVPFDFPGLAVMRAFKRVLTGAITSTPEFMAANLVRDSVAAQMISPHGFSPTKTLAGIKKSYSEAGGYETMLFAGASFQSGNTNAADPAGTATAMRRALRDRGFDASSTDAFMASILDTPIKFWEKYRHVGESIENANREAVFEATTKAGKSATEAAYNAKDLMDFSLRGSSPVYQFLADVLPFFNARVQGLYRVGRADPKRLVAYGMLMTAASLALAWANGDNDDYDKLQDWDKDTYWHFWIRGEHFRIPKPFELGVAFATIPERIMRYAKGQDSGKKFAGRMWANVRDQLAFDPLPQLFRPAVNAWANKDTFRDRAIEGMADEGKVASHRYSAGTSATARVAVSAIAPVADEIGLSPKKLEYLVGGYLGTVGLYALSLSDMAVKAMEGKPPGPAKRLDEYPIIRRFYRMEPPTSTVYESDFYKLRTEIEQIYKSAMADEREGNIDAARKMFEANKEKMAVRKGVAETAAKLAKLNKYRDTIYASPTMTSEEKRVAVDKILAEKAALTARVMQHPAIRAAQ